jgi:hypothetical protein
MQTGNRITKFITMTLIVASMAMMGSTGTADAQHVRVFDGVTFASVVPGQMLRFSIFNLNGPEQGPVRVQVRLYDGQGNILVHTPQVELPPRESRSFEFDREDLPTPGDPRTGSAFSVASIQVLLGDGSARSSPGQFPASMELVDKRTGGTVLVSSISYGVRVGAVDR